MRARKFDAFLRDHYVNGFGQETYEFSVYTVTRFEEIGNVITGSYDYDEETGRTGFKIQSINVIDHSIADEPERFIGQFVEPNGLAHSISLPHKGTVGGNNHHKGSDAPLKTIPKRAGITNDCFPTALAYVIKEKDGGDMDQIYKDLINEIRTAKDDDFWHNWRTHSRGQFNAVTPHEESIRLCEKHNLVRVDPSQFKNPDKKTVSVSDVAKSRINAVVFVRGHAIAVLDGIVIDKFDSRRRKVTKVYVDPKFVRYGRLIK